MKASFDYNGCKMSVVGGASGISLCISDGGWAQTGAVLDFGQA